MQTVWIVFGELLILLLLANRITNTFYTLFSLLLRNKHAAMAVITLIYLPGTVIHELAHLLTAEILRVPTGELTFTPKLEKGADGRNEVRAGSLQIGTVDPIRLYLIGFAPVIFGLFFVSLIIWIFTQYWSQMITLGEQILFISLIGYLLFAVSNTMFSSKKDLEGFLIFVPIFLAIALTLYVTGFRLTLTGQALVLTQQVLTNLAKALGIVVGINLTMLMVNLLFLRGLLKLFHFE